LRFGVGGFVGRMRRDVDVTGACLLVAADVDLQAVESLEDGVGELGALGRGGRLADVGQGETGERAAQRVGGIGARELAAAGYALDREVGLRPFIACDAEARSLRRLLADRDHAALIDVEDGGIEPELRIGLGQNEGTREQALRRVDHPYVAVIAVHRAADDQRPGLARGDDVDAHTRGLRLRHILDAKHRVIAREARLTLYRVQRTEIEQELAQLAGVGGVAAFPDDPIGCMPLESRLRLVGLGDADLCDGVDGAFEARKHRSACDRVLAALAAAGHPGGERNDGDADGKEERDAACGHGSLPLSFGMAAGRRRRRAAMRSAASAKNAGITMMSMTLSSVPSLSMLLTRPAWTARSCLRIWSFSASKRSISCCCSGVRISADLSLRFDCNSVSCCSVCCSSCCNCSSWAWKRESATFRRAST